MGFGPPGAGAPPPPAANGARELVALHGLDLDIEDGEFFGLLGPNGAGKTTTIGILTTRVAATGGRASVAGADVIGDPVSVRRRIGVVPQRANPDRGLNVLENLVFHAAYFGIARSDAVRRAMVHLERFGMHDKAHEKVDALSGGQQQRLMIARALIHEPTVLFLDEPTVGLDPQARLALWDLLRELHRQGRTIVMTTHYMQEADQLCDRLAIIDRGRLLALDATAALKAQAPGGTLIELSLDGPADAAAIQVRALDHVSRAEAAGGHPAHPQRRGRPDHLRRHRGRRGRRTAGAKHHARGAEPRDALHRTHGEEARLTHPVAADPPVVRTSTVFIALLRRDVRVAMKELPFFLLRTVMQPVLFLIVFGFLLPKMGMVRGGYQTTLLPGILAVSLALSAIQSVALPMVQDFGWTREIEDRLLAPVATWVIAAEKIVSGVIQGVVAALFVLPLARLIMGPIPNLTFVHLGDVLAITVLGATAFSALGMWLGTAIAPQQIGLMFSAIIAPMMFFGCAYYPWRGLDAVPVMKYAVLVNPLVYVAEGMRGSLTPDVPHMPLVVSTGALLVISALFWMVGLRSFRKRAIG